MKPDALDHLIKLSMLHWAKYCRNLLAQGRSENQVKAALSRKVAGKASPQGIDMVFRMGCELWREEKAKAMPVIIVTE